MIAMAVAPEEKRDGGSAVWTFLAFAVALSLALLAPLAFGDVLFNRARFSAWGTLLVGTPALFLFVLRLCRMPLGRDWLTWWTAGLAMYLVHLWYGFVLSLGASLRVTYELQGTLVATSNFAVAALWLASVVAGWFAWRAMLLHLTATLLFAVSAITSSLIFGRWPSPLIGAVVAIALAGAVLYRLAVRPSGMPSERRYQ
jgi:uncharacterized integral membrane protein